jgi:hypothetical protein
MIELKSETVIIESLKKKKEISKFGTYRKKIKNGKIFCIDKKTEQVKEAMYEKSNIASFKLGSRKSKLVIEKGKIYVEALNAKNAIKKIKQGKIVFAS